MAKQFNSKNVIQTDSNGVIPLGDNIHQSKTQEFQLSQTDQQPSQIHQNQEILGFGSFKIDQNRKIIEFGESESSEETIQEKFQIKRENKQYFDNEQEVQLNNLERKHEENIPSTYREKQQSNTCIDIKQQKLILKHKQKKQQSKQDLSKIENNTQYIEQNQEQIHSIQENNNDENQQNIQQIQQHDNTLVPDKTSSINQQIKQIQCVKDNEDHSSGQQIFQEQSNTDHHIQQQQQQMHENQVELINFECNESIEIQNDNIKSTSDQHQGLGLNMEDIQVILSNEENVPSQKTFDQQSARKQSHNNDIKSDWQKYLKNE